MPENMELHISEPLSQPLSHVNINQVDTCLSTDANLIFLDWDDTLLCSSFLSSEGFRLDNNLPTDEHTLNQIQELETCVCKVLKMALSLGTVHVITNAETGWVEMSAQKFFPRTLGLLSQIKILSARSTYEHMYPDCPMKWKYCAFLDQLSPYFSDNRFKKKNIVSFGDSQAEREAVLMVTKGVPNTQTKSVKFAEHPTIEQLQRQVELVLTCFSHIIDHDGDLDLCMSLSANPTTNDNSLTNDQVPAETCS